MAGITKKSPKQVGFTIIEVMIFLAVSGLTFLIAATFISGKEAQAEFVTGMRNANNIVNNTINDVANGNYPLPVSYSCSVTSGVPIVTSSSGDHVGCVLIGKVIVPETNSDANRYSIFSVVGCQFVFNGVCSATQGVAPTDLANEGSTVVNFMTQSNNWPGGVSITKLLLVSGANTTNIGAFGIFGGLPQINGGVYVSGSQAANVVVVNNSLISDSSSQIESLVNSSGLSLLNGSYIVMCFSGGNNHKAGIVIGGSNQGGQLTTTLQMENNATQC